MSLILEALRKSEAERRRGEVPDLLSEPVVSASRPGRAGWPRGWPWTAAALAVVLALPVAWLLRGDPTGSGATPEVPAEAAEPPVAAAPAGAPPPVPPPSTAIPLDPASPASPAPAPGLVAAPSPEPAVPRSPDPVPAPAAAIPAPPADPMPELSAPELGPAAATPGAVTEPVETPVPEPGPGPVPAPPPDSARFAPLSGLSGEERRQLPPLKVSMHMWSEDPGRRFAIIDGNRVGEGDMVGNAVVIGITRDAVVLDWQGRRLEVPIR